uniref:Fucolectin tachylectin-4 pentraxin-1 domain-containing protein n=1 Tax=Xenopus tropicalis TaxID=8364 RepID=A0A6I8SHZ6_XENTR
ILVHPCTHTDYDNPAWWQLNLKKRYKIGTIVIVNRGDCCSERLLGAEVRVGDSADNNNPICGTITKVSQATITLSCNGMEGRYVSVVIPGREEYLQLCEVEVYGEESYEVRVMNVARLGDVRQSSTYEPQYGAETAVDGVKETDISIHPCTHTMNDNPAWWRLDLKKRFIIESVVIVNRGDCCSERLLGAEIRVGDSPDNNNPVCGTITDVSHSPITLSCNGMEGRYVSVVIPGREEYLTLCEVESYMLDLYILAVNVARLGDVRQSSTYEPHYSAETAIDGIIETDISIHPCTHTFEDNPAWWRLDLKKVYKVDSVVIVNRRDCCSERLIGAQIRVGDSADNNNPVCGTIFDVSKATITILCNGLEGRYVSVVIPGREEYLTLCEVENGFKIS